MLGYLLDYLLTIKSKYLSQLKLSLLIHLCIIKSLIYQLISSLVLFYYP